MRRPGRSRSDLRTALPVLRCKYLDHGFVEPRKVVGFARCNQGMIPRHRLVRPRSAGIDQGRLSSIVGSRPAHRELIHLLCAVSSDPRPGAPTASSAVASICRRGRRPRGFGLVEPRKLGGLRQPRAASRATFSRMPGLLSIFVRGQNSRRRCNIRVGQEAFLSFFARRGDGCLGVAGGRDGPVAGRLLA